MILLKRFLPRLLLSCLLLPTTGVLQAATTTPKIATPSISVKVTQPKGSAGDAFGAKIMKSMLLTPCLSEDSEKKYGAISGLEGINVNNSFDQLNIKITGTNVNNDNDKWYDFDLYFFLINLTASGTDTDIPNSQFFVFRRFNALTSNVKPNGGFSGIEIIPKALAQDLDKADVLLRRQDFGTDKIDETILGGNISVDKFNLPQGTWMAVAILASNDNDIDFEDPATWAVWDATPFILGVPWRTRQLTCK